MVSLVSECLVSGGRKNVSQIVNFAEYELQQLSHVSQHTSFQRFESTCKLLRLPVVATAGL